MRAPAAAVSRADETTEAGDPQGVPERREQEGEARVVGVDGDEAFGLRGLKAERALGDAARGDSEITTTASRSRASSAARRGASGRQL